MTRALTLSVLAAALLGCAEESPSTLAEASAQAPVPPGEPTFVVSQLIPGGTMRATWADLPPGTIVYFGVSPGTGAGPCPALMAGDCLDIGPRVTLLGSTAANADGVASLTATVPRNLPSSTTANFQAIALRFGSTYLGKSDVYSRWIGPGICPAIWAPVCGVDGNTYGNDCEAEAAGWPTDDYGTCP